MMAIMSAMMMMMLIMNLMPGTGEANESISFTVNNGIYHRLVNVHHFSRNHHHLLLPGAQVLPGNIVKNKPILHFPSWASKVRVV